MRLLNWRRCFNNKCKSMSICVMFCKSRCNIMDCISLWVGRSIMVQVKERVTMISKMNKKKLIKQIRTCNKAQQIETHPLNKEIASQNLPVPSNSWSQNVQSQLLTYQTFKSTLEDNHFQIIHMKIIHIIVCINKANKS